MLETLDIELKGLNSLRSDALKISLFFWFCEI